MTKTRFLLRLVARPDAFRSLLLWVIIDLGSTMILFSTSTAISILSVAFVNSFLFHIYENAVLNLAGSISGSPKSFGNIDVSSVSDFLSSLQNVIRAMFFFEWIHIQSFPHVYLMIAVTYLDDTGFNFLSNSVIIPGTSLFATAFATLVWLWLFFSVALVGKLAKFVVATDSVLLICFRYLLKNPTVILQFGIIPSIVIAGFGIIIGPLIVAIGR